MNCMGGTPSICTSPQKRLGLMARCPQPSAARVLGAVSLRSELTRYGIRPPVRSRSSRCAINAKSESCFYICVSSPAEEYRMHSQFHW